MSLFLKLWSKWWQQQGQGEVWPSSLSWMKPWRKIWKRFTSCWSQRGSPSVRRFCTLLGRRSCLMLAEYVNVQIMFCLGFFFAAKLFELLRNFPTKKLQDGLLFDYIRDALKRSRSLLWARSSNTMSPWEHLIEHRTQFNILCQTRLETLVLQ